jgi:hypothetical protein
VCYTLTCVLLNDYLIVATKDIKNLVTERRSSFITTQRQSEEEERKKNSNWNRVRGVKLSMAESMSVAGPRRRPLLYSLHHSFRLYPPLLINKWRRGISHITLPYILLPSRKPELLASHTLHGTAWRNRSGSDKGRRQGVNDVAIWRRPADNKRTVVGSCAVVDASILYRILQLLRKACWRNNDEMFWRDSIMPAGVSSLFSSPFQRYGSWSLGKPCAFSFSLSVLHMIKKNHIVSVCFFFFKFNSYLCRHMCLIHCRCEPRQLWPYCQKYVYIFQQRRRLFAKILASGTRVSVFNYYDCK